MFKGFDYVALGHIHKPQQIGRKEIETVSDRDVISKNGSRMHAGQRDVLPLFEVFYQEVRQTQLSEESKKVVTDIVKELKTV